MNARLVCFARTAVLVHCVLLLLQLLIACLLFHHFGGRLRDVQHIFLIGAVLFSLVPLLGLAGLASKSRILVGTFAVLHLLVTLPATAFLLLIFYNLSGGSVSQFVGSVFGLPLIMDLFGAALVQVAAMLYLMELMDQKRSECQLAESDACKSAD